MSVPIAPPDVWNWMVDHFKPVEIQNTEGSTVHKDSIVVKDSDLCIWATKLPLAELDEHCFKCKYKTFQLANIFVYNGSKGQKMIKCRFLYDSFKILDE